MIKSSERIHGIPILTCYDFNLRIAQVLKVALSYAVIHLLLQMDFITIDVIYQ